MLAEYEETLEYLYGLHRMGIKPGLEHTEKGCRAFNHPEKSFRVVHIAGTNGKGSVAAMVTTMLRKAGYKVGLFTSPHLITFRERIQVNGRIIPKQEVVHSANLIQTKDLGLTFFETITLMAFMYFRQEEVDFAVLETGMGGRLDSTNVTQSEICAITNIDFDHTEFLGDSIKEITTEKAAIIKKNSTVIVPSLGKKAMDIIEERVHEMGASLIVADMYNGNVSLLGQFQKENAGIAFAIGKHLKVKDEVIKEGLATTFWPGRCEYITENVLMDCAHNVAGIRALTKFVKTQQYDRLIIIFGVQFNKNYKAMIKALPKPDVLVLTKPRIQKALDPYFIEKEGECKIIEDPKEALTYAQSIAGAHDLILVAGSCYLVGNMLEPEPEITFMLPKAM